MLKWTLSSGMAREQAGSREQAPTIHVEGATSSEDDMFSDFSSLTSEEGGRREEEQEQESGREESRKGGGCSEEGGRREEGVSSERKERCGEEGRRREEEGESEEPESMEEGGCSEVGAPKDHIDAGLEEAAGELGEAKKETAARDEGAVGDKVMEALPACLPLPPSFRRRNYLVSASVDLHLNYWLAGAKVCLYHDKVM